MPERLPPDSPFNETSDPLTPDNLERVDSGEIQQIMSRFDRESAYRALP